LYVLALGLLSLAVSLAVQPVVLRALGETVTPADIVAAGAAGLLLFTLYTVFQLPGYYKFGAIKGRIFMYIPVAGFLATLFFLPAGLPVAVSPALACALVAAVVVVLYAASAWCSVRIMKNKEL
ncbi:MAG: ABC-2 transporter permease, partial [Blautia massiliensis (ex Durand et al. 2017)]